MRLNTFLCFCFLLLLSACSGLAGEPPIIATLPHPTPRAGETGYPTAPPDLASGARIFAENCTRCHGQLGDGKGELVLAGQIAEPPADFTDPLTAREQSPVQWYGTITNGRLEKLMPPWRDSLSEQARWAVALYTYTMSYQPDEIALGQTIWNTNCAECHGAAGAGDGPRATELDAPVSNLAQPETLIDRSDSVLFNIITQGKGEVMPAFGNQLDETQRWQVIAYLRTLSLANAGAIGQAVPPPPAATAEVEVAAAPLVPGRVSGRVTNGTAGGVVNPDLQVTLYIVDNQFNQQTQETTVADDGTFTFDAVPIANDYAYLVTTSYQGRTFGSRMTRGDSSSPALDIPITIYEITDDDSVITISDIATQISDLSNTLQVTQIMNFRNGSDRLYSQSGTIGGTRFASVVIPLPPGAQIQGTANETQRYTRSQDGTSLIDTRPVYPGEDHVVHITYTVPFEGKADIELPLSYGLNGPVQILLQSDRLSISSPQLAPLSPQTMGGVVFQTYGGNLALSAGANLRYSITQSAGFNTIFSGNILAYVFIGVGSLAILGAALLYFYERRFPRLSANNQQLVDVLIEQIAELDDMYQKKQINSKAYQAQRKRLKERLAKLMEKE
jgi:mono/diheme cytochrome c family protein